MRSTSPRFAQNQVSRELNRVAAATPVGKLPARRKPTKSTKTAPELAETSAFQSGMRAMLSEWSSLSDRMATLLTDLASGGVPREEKAREQSREHHHTPMGDFALQKASERPSFKPEIRKGKLYFTCPACQHPTAVFKAYTGKATRCPSCFSAIRTPDPRNGRKAHNLERDIDAFLHPDRITAVLPRRRTIFTAVPLPTLNTFLAIAGSALLLGGSALSMRTAAVSGEAELATESPTPSSKVDTSGLSGRAIELVEGFLDARGPVAKSAYVRDGGRIAPLMKQAFSEGAEPIGFRSVELVSSGLSPVPGEDQFVSRIMAHLPGGISQEFIVQHLEHGDFIEWEASTGYNAHPWAKIAKRAEGTDLEVAQLRVLARPDNYFNYDYSDEDQFYCVRLESPDTRELLGYGYATREQAETIGLLAATLAADSSDPERLTLDLRFSADTARNRQVEIIGVANHGWRALPGTMLAGMDMVEPE